MIHLQWLDESKRCMVCVFDKQWTVEAYQQTIAHSKVLMDGVMHPVSIIFDTRQTATVPTHFIMTIARPSLKMPPYQYMIVVGANPVIRHTFNLMGRLHHHATEFRFVPSMHDAIRLVSPSFPDEAVV